MRPDDGDLIVEVDRVYRHFAAFTDLVAVDGKELCGRIGCVQRRKLEGGRAAGAIGDAHIIVAIDRGARPGYRAVVQPIDLQPVKILSAPDLIPGQRAVGVGDVVHPHQQLVRRDDRIVAIDIAQRVIVRAAARCDQLVGIDSGQSVAGGLVPVGSTRGARYCRGDEPCRRAGRLAVDKAGIDDAVVSGSVGLNHEPGIVVGDRGQARRGDGCRSRFAGCVERVVAGQRSVGSGDRVDAQP